MFCDIIVEFLLNYSVEVNVVLDLGRIVLSYVCEYCCNDIVDIFVKYVLVDFDIFDIDGMYKKLL